MASRSSRTSSRKPATLNGPELPTHEVKTAFSTIKLDIDRDNPRSLTVLLDGAPSSFIDLDNPDNVVFEYMEIFLKLIAEFPEGPLNVTHLGAAGSTMARAVEHQRPNSRQIGIDIDQELLDFARTWFELPKAPRLRLRGGDARAQLETLHPQSQDVIIRDVFAHGGTPAHLTSVEFTQLCLSKLKPGGLYLVNCADKPPLSRARREVATLLAAATAYDNEDDSPNHTRVALIAEPGILKGRRFGNLVLALALPSPEEGGHSVDFTSAFVARTLRSLAVPAHVLADEEAIAFAATAQVLKDE